MDLAWLLDVPPQLGDVRLVAVDGPSGSGKSVLADTITADLRARGVDTGLVRTDDFATWDDPVSWWPRLVTGVLEPLARGETGCYRRHDWVDGIPRPGAEIRVPVPRILVVEGVSAGRTSIRPRLSALIWCAFGDAGQRLERAVARDGEASRAPLRAWQAFEDGWFAVDDPRAVADVIWTG